MNSGSAHKLLTTSFALAVVQCIPVVSGTISIVQYISNVQILVHLSISVQLALVEVIHIIILAKLVGFSIQNALVLDQGQINRKLQTKKELFFVLNLIFSLALEVILFQILVIYKVFDISYQLDPMSALLGVQTVFYTLHNQMQQLEDKRHTIFGELNRKPEYTYLWTTLNKMIQTYFQDSDLILLIQMICLYSKQQWKSFQKDTFYWSHLRFKPIPLLNFDLHTRNNQRSHQALQYLSYKQFPQMLI